MSNNIINEKIQQAVGILKEKNVDMWITFVRESSIITDPMIDMIVGGNATWQSAFIINKDGETTAIVGSIEEDNFRRPGIYQNVITYIKSIREPLVEYIKSKNTKSFPCFLSISASIFFALSVNGASSILPSIFFGFFRRLISP